MEWGEEWAGFTIRPFTAGRDQPRTDAPDGWLQMHDASSAASGQRQFREGSIIDGKS